MRKLILTAISALAITGAVAGTASANVAVDNGAGYVGKGDVQTALGWNNAAFDKNAASIKFTQKFQTHKDTSWMCSDGSVRHHIFSTSQDQPLKADATLNSNGKQITGWNLNGLAADYYLAPMTTSVTGNDGSGRFPSYSCPAGSYMDYMTMNVNQTHEAALFVNGVSLPNTPVEVAPVVPAP
jgi:hypothetical protein